MEGACPLGTPDLRHTPDARKVLKAAEIGNAEMRISAFANPRPSKIVWEGRNWEWLPLSGPINAKTRAFGGENYRDLSASDHFFFQAWGTTAAGGMRKVGAGSIYFSTMKDSSGTYFDGGENYKLTIPGPVPAKLFWSVTVYDSGTRTIMNTDQGRGAVRMMFEKPTANADGNFDVFFGPDAPKGKENHWVKTIPGKGGLHTFACMVQKIHFLMGPISSRTLKS